MRDIIRELLTSQDIRDINETEISKAWDNLYLDNLNQHLALLLEIDFKITAGIRNLYTENLIFGADTNRGKILFKFANREYSPHIAFETNSFNNLIQMMQIIAMTQVE